MYAVIQTGGKQYKVTEGSRIKVEKIASQAGERLQIGRVLAVEKDGKFLAGRPEVAGAGVFAEVIGHEKAGKVTAYKYRKRKDSDRKVGHRQEYTELKIEQIKLESA